MPLIYCDMAHANFQLFVYIFKISCLFTRCFFQDGSVLVLYRSRFLIFHRGQGHDRPLYTVTWIMHTRVLGITFGEDVV